MSNFKLLYLTVALTPLVGCTATLQDLSYSWSHHKHAYCASLTAPEVSVFNCDKMDGWRQGYYDYSMGRRCKPPVIPPKQYWSAKYQCPAGQKHIAEWYLGYELGVIAAEKCCGDCWHYPRVRSDVAAGYSHGEFPDIVHPQQGMTTEETLSDVPLTEAVPSPVPGEKVPPLQLQVPLIPMPPMPKIEEAAPSVPKKAPEVKTLPPMPEIKLPDNPAPEKKTPAAEKKPAAVEKKPAPVEPKPTAKPTPTVVRPTPTKPTPAKPKTAPKKDQTLFDAPDLLIHPTSFEEAIGAISSKPEPATPVQPARQSQDSLFAAPPTP